MCVETTKQGEKAGRRTCARFTRWRVGFKGLVSGHGPYRCEVSGLLVGRLLSTRAWRSLGSGSFFFSSSTRSHLPPLFRLSRTRFSLSLTSFLAIFFSCYLNKPLVLRCSLCYCACFPRLLVCRSVFGSRSFRLWISIDSLHVLSLRVAPEWRITRLANEDKSFCFV